jgi:hypothetical protein
MTGQKIVAPASADKRNLMGFSVHRGITSGGRDAARREKKFVNFASTELSDLLMGRGEGNGETVKR